MEIRTDYLVIGSGIAGLSFALEAAKAGTVAIITKKQDSESNTNYAQGGIACVLAPDDSFDLHIEDTLRTGRGLCRRDAVEMVVKKGPEMVNRLLEWGVNFTMERMEAGERLALEREGGHSKSRIVHASDLTGAEIERALLDRVKSEKNITIYEDHIAIDLITEHHLRILHPAGNMATSMRSRMNDSTKSSSGQRKITCWGAYVLNTRRGEVDKFLAKVTLLATGGAGKVYLHTTNPEIATGDGIAMAYRAGAEIANLEFMQFHPTSLYHPDGKSFLISEAVRGYGGILRTKDGQAFMQKYHLMGDLAPRDIVARAIDRELKARGDDCVWLDVTHLDPEETRQRFPHIYERCKSVGIDMTLDPVPVVPAAHYMCGGVRTDLWGRTTIVNLYATGEVACTGVHGANRLASNSLLEALVFSRQAYQDSLTVVRDKGFTFPEIPDWNEENTFNAEEWVLLAHDRLEIQQLMWDYVGIVRSDLRLKRAQKRICLIAEEIEEFYKRTKVTPDLIELRNIATVAQLIIHCALARKESRGLHFNTDYPQQNDGKYLRDTVITNEALE
ncbi:MAG TPA: L-aspartate oxidase [Candidatus Latescibacteria bacterium]|nr:L-aspartate oxidase [Candidatus Latescibacterota bacterium]